MPLDPRLATAWERFLALIPLFLGLAHAGVWALAALTIGRLDGPFPVHFDAAGRPDGFAEPSSWWTLPAIGLAIIVVMVGVLALTRWLMVRHPGIVNVPDKRAFMGLSHAARLRLMPRVTQLVLGFVLIAHFILLAVIRDTHRVAIGELTELSVWKLVVLMSLHVVWLVVGILRIRNQIRREVASGTGTAAS